MERLTHCEEQAMKIIWDNDQPTSMIEVVEGFKQKYDQDYARQTVSTFLAHLKEKGFVVTEKKGRVTYYQAIVPFKAYRNKRTCEFLNFWYGIQL